MKEQILSIKIFTEKFATLIFVISIILGCSFPKIVFSSELKRGKHSHDLHRGEKVCNEIKQRFLAGHYQSLLVRPISVTNEIIEYRFRLGPERKEDILRRTCFGGVKFAECLFNLTTPSGQIREFYGIGYDRLLGWKGEFYLIGGVYFDNRRVWISEFSATKLGRLRNESVCPLSSRR